MGISKIARRLDGIKSRREREGLNPFAIKLKKEEPNDQEDKVKELMLDPSVEPQEPNKLRRKRMQSSEFVMEEVGIEKSKTRRASMRYPFDKLTFVRNEDGTIIRNSFVVRDKVYAKFAGTFTKARKRLEEDGLIPDGAMLVYSQEGDNLRIGYAEATVAGGEDQ